MKDLELSEEVITEIFNTLHPDENNLISSKEVEKLIMMIMSLNDEKKDRTSIIYDKSQMRFTQSPNLGSGLSQNQNEENTKIAHDVLNGLSLEKLTDLKFIYHSADKNSKKFVGYEKLMKSKNAHFLSFFII